MNTPQLSSLLGDILPVYAVSDHSFNSAIGRRVVASEAEGLVKNNYPPQTANGLHETVQSSLARPRQTREGVQEQMFNSADFVGNVGV